MQVIGCLRQDLADGHTLGREELECGIEAEAVAEHHAQHVERDGDEERGQYVAALVGAQRGQEEREQLPEDEGAADEDRHEERHAELQREALERTCHIDIGHVVAHGENEEVDEIRREQVHEADRDRERDDDDDDATTQLADMIHEWHARGTDGHLTHRLSRRRGRRGSPPCSSS